MIVCQPMNMRTGQIAKGVFPADPVPGDPEAIAALLKSAGDPLRLQILRVLSNNAFGALELSDIFAMRQNAMSHHLKLLSKSGLVNSRREGTHIFYRLSNHQGPYRELCEAIYSAAANLELPADVARHCEEIQDIRAATSREFFRVNATKFRRQQDLIASYPQYGEAVLATLDNCPLLNTLPLSGKTVLEVGPGEGELLPGLRQRFGTLIALDNSAEMLARAEAFAASQGLGDVTFILGDTASPDLRDISADAITLNMVLHHTPAPAAIINDLAQRLLDGGVLVITELCHHDQDWVREACGDLWLGFEPEELGAWAASAGLEDGGSEFLALKNGFSIQIRQFRKPGKTAGLHKLTRVSQP